jgi:hypothetical protein
MADSAYFAVNLEITSSFTIGALLGGSFISTGIGRVLVALGGREIANDTIPDKILTA